MSEPSTEPAALELEAVDASYGPYRALFSVSFSLERGAVTALLGPNGAGKSTIARVASGLVVPTSGRVLVGGHDVTHLPPWRIARAGVAHVPEGRGIFATLSVEENLVLALRRSTHARGRLDRAATAALLAKTYDRFGVLGSRRRDRAGTLSGGQQRLLSLAKVLVAAPKVLVADELSLGLAPAVVDDVYRALRAIAAEGAALLVVEQDVERALSLASAAVVLEHGSLAYSGPASGALEAVERVLSRRELRDAPFS